MIWAGIDGEPVDRGTLDERVESAVAEITARQRDVGIDILSDGELSKSADIRRIVVVPRASQPTSRSGCKAANTRSWPPPVGAQLRQKRSESGMSLRELARRVDVSASSVSQIETGRIQPSVRTLYAIVSELGLSLDEMFELVEPAEIPVAGASHATDAAVDLQRAGAAPVRSSAQRTVITLGLGVTVERLTAWADPSVDFVIAVYGRGSRSSAEDHPTPHSGRVFFEALIRETDSRLRAVVITLLGRHPEAGMLPGPCRLLPEPDRDQQ